MVARTMQFNEPATGVTPAGKLGGTLKINETVVYLPENALAAMIVLECERTGNAAATARATEAFASLQTLQATKLSAAEDNVNAPPANFEMPDVRTATLNAETIDSLTKALARYQAAVQQRLGRNDFAACL